MAAHGISAEKAVWVKAVQAKAVLVASLELAMSTASASWTAIEIVGYQGGKGTASGGFGGVGGEWDGEGGELQVILLILAPQ